MIECLFSNASPSSAMPSTGGGESACLFVAGHFSRIRNLSSVPRANLVSEPGHTTPQTALHVEEGKVCQTTTLSPRWLLATPKPLLRPTKEIPGPVFARLFNRKANPMTRLLFVYVNMDGLVYK